MAEGDWGDGGMPWGGHCLHWSGDLFGRWLCCQCARGWEISGRVEGMMIALDMQRERQIRTGTDAEHAASFMGRQA